MIYNVNAVADWFLGRMNTDSGDTVSALKLQKLIYYAQAWHLTKYGKPLFAEKIESWVHGPTVAKIYHRFKEIPRDGAIGFEHHGDTRTDFSFDVEDLLEEIFCTYGEHSAGYLEALSCSEHPYKKARKGLDMLEKPDSEITHQSMIDYYKKFNNGKKASK